MKLWLSLFPAEGLDVLPYWLLNCVFCLISVLLTFVLVHLITVGRLPFRLAVGKQLANLVCFFLVINAGCLLFVRTELACLFGELAVLLLATANYYVFRFKGTELAFTDFYAIGTAANVASHYSYRPERRVVFAWMIWLIFTLLRLCFRLPSPRQPWLIRGLAFVFELLALAAFLLCTRRVRGTHWSNEGSLHYGFFLNFMLGVKGLFGLKPKGYRKEQIEEISRKAEEGSSHSRQTSEQADIVVIMNESFADLGVLGKEPETTIPVLPVFHSVKENAIRGYALSSVFGGTTANSEYEFLTGNSMAFFPYGSIPYMQFIHEDAYSLVAELKKQGYRCMATHPYLASGWSRPTVYPAFGFDRITFDEAYPKLDTPRGYISDNEMYDYLIGQYEQLSKDGNLFLFGVTVQNHGDYAGRSQMVENTVFLRNTPGKYPDADQYLTLLRRSDEAIEKLISYFSRQKRKVVLCFFGDHLPGLDPAFLQELHGGAFSSLDEQQQTRMIPFFIWANYPLEQQVIECTSLNYLATHVLEAAGLDLSPYRLFLKKMEQEIPSINADAYYSTQQGCFRPFTEAAGREAELLQDYRVMVYHNAIDRKKRDRRVFPSAAQGSGVASDKHQKQS